MPSNKKTLLILVVIFFGPLLVAWWLAMYGPEYIPQGQAAKGELIHPAYPLQWFEIGLPLTGKKLNREFFLGKWTYVMFAPGHCDNDCRDNLYKTRQVRLTQGGDEHRTQRLIVFTKPFDRDLFQQTLTEHRGLVVAEELQTSTTGLQVQFDTPGKLSGIGAGIYLVDPLANLFIFYPQGTDPTDMRKDLKKLLHASQIG